MIKQLLHGAGGLAALILAPVSDAFGKIYRYLYAGWWSARLDAPGLDMKPRVNAIVSPRRVRMGSDCVIGKEAVISAWESLHGRPLDPRIEIGDRVRLGDFIHITCIDRVAIGDGTLTGRWVTITDNSHGRNTSEEMTQAPNDREVVSKGPVVIGRNVWIADKVTILPGVTIGDGAIIGANSVVTKDIPPRCIAGGIPAKVIREL